jgi:hypothetical protein
MGSSTPGEMLFNCLYPLGSLLEIYKPYHSSPQIFLSVEKQGYVVKITEL